ncbi:glyoxylate/hydroxypyruvate reductase A [Pseudovibrio sp. SPO723]|uniref:2-hydroxyacid dehydrogenase n=1 Tax=Nesiotobacter zosterae TaxID=392721 RepID=UPI0029C1C91C|nr:glyoxylate/hydroxypyruvate reductase A [Pseudovibrio sp. SPO723]MDX5592368.1 glyoxylate/hydroxypyruvate reductase A [Pseudovibrio sp. SPO723]
MTLVIAVRNFNAEEWAERMRKRLPGKEVVIWQEGAVLPEDVAYVLAWKPEEAVFETIKTPKAIFSLGAGVDHLMKLDNLPEAPVVRIVDPDLTARMTEWVVLQVLLHHRSHLTYDAQQADRLWKGHRQPAAKHVRVGLLGLGELGGDAARALSRLGFKVSGWSRRSKVIEGVKSYAGEERLDAFLANTDILVNLLPHTTATTGLVDGELLSKLAPDGALGGPVYINAGRGATQVEADIAKMLQEGTLKGASLDVFADEPLATESPLWDAPGCVITPHVAAESDPEALSDYIAEQIKAFEAGRPLQNVVDPRTGY